MLDAIERYRRHDRNYIPRGGEREGRDDGAGIGSARRAGHPRYCRDMNQRLLPRRGIGNLSLLRRDIPAETVARQSYTVNYAVRGDCPEPTKRFRYGKFTLGLCVARFLPIE